MGKGAIGTTARGIGPAYTDKAARFGLRTELLADSDKFSEVLSNHVDTHNHRLEVLFGAEPEDKDEILDQLLEAGAYLQPYLADTSSYLHKALKADKYVVCEGAQGTLLDIDHGQYPYVTSSSSTSGGAATGLGIGPNQITRVTGVMKAFSTRVGSGPFPTELEGELGDRLRGTGANPWDEFGTTTGRPRRCGWLDTVVVRYGARINGLTDLIITKLDILSGFDTIKIADQYTSDGQTISEIPTSLETLQSCDPVYQDVAGWSEDIMGVTDYKNLPSGAQGYIKAVEDIVGLEVVQVTVGPGREQAINL